MTDVPLPGARSVKPLRPFRFGWHCNYADTPGQFVDRARRAEEFGYSTFTIGDHFRKQFAPLPALMAAAAATTTLRVGPLVLGNDYKHPLVLAKELATMDQFTGGRLQVGIGSGWMHEDYEWSGMPFDRAGTRVERLQESLTILKGLWGAEPFTFHGAHYDINAHDGTPKPVQKPRPPILIGAGGRRMLQLAAQEADIININVNLRTGVQNVAALMQDSDNADVMSYQKKIGWIKEAAAGRFDDIELSVACTCIVTDDRDKTVHATALSLGVPAEYVASSPIYLIGSHDEMAADLEQRRAELGVSYVVFYDDVAASLAPLVSRLAGR